MAPADVTSRDGLPLRQVAANVNGTRQQVVDAGWPDLPRSTQEVSMTREVELVFGPNVIAAYAQVADVRSGSHEDKLEVE